MDNNSVAFSCFNCGEINVNCECLEEEVEEGIESEESKHCRKLKNEV